MDKTRRDNTQNRQKRIEKKGLNFISNLNLNKTNIFLERGTSKLNKIIIIQ